MNYTQLTEKKLEIDILLKQGLSMRRIASIQGKRNEQDSLISIVDRCTRRLWLIKADYK